MYDNGYCGMGPRDRFYSYISLVMLMIGTGCFWVELPIQRRFCPIFMRDVGSTDIHECFRGLTGSQRTPGIWGVTKHMAIKLQNYILIQRKSLNSSILIFIKKIIYFLKIIIK